MKKRIGWFLVLVLLAVSFPAGRIFAEGTTKNISQVKVTFNRAIIGENVYYHLDYVESIHTDNGFLTPVEADTSYTAGFTDGIKWEKQNGTSYTVISAGEKFEAGVTYRVTLRLKPAIDGYAFPPVSSSNSSPYYNLTHYFTKINGQTAQVESYSETLMVISGLITAAEAEVVDELDFWFIDPPVPGENPKMGGGSSTYFSQPENIVWKDLTTGETLSGTSVFIAGHSYSESFRLTTNNKYYLADEFTISGCDELSDFTYTIPSGGRFNNGIRSIDVTLYFGQTPELIVLDTITLTDIETPVADESPSLSPETIVGTGYSCLYVSWHDLSEEGTGLFFLDVFLAKHTYKLEIRLKTSRGYQFASEGLTATINGQMASVEYDSTNCEISIMAEFYCASTDIEISQVESDNVTPPKPGAPPSYTAAIKGTGYRVSDYTLYSWQNGILWEIMYPRQTLDAESTFVKGNNYVIRIRIVAEPGYTFPETGLLAKVNGMRTTMIDYEDDENIMISCIWSCKDQTGWVQEGGCWYYYGEDGSPKTSWQKIGGTWYYFNGSGVMQTGWQKISNKWYYFNTSGAMQTGWQQIGGKWYYLGASGDMKTGWVQVSGKWYYMNASGVMQTGWQQIGDKWYYFNASGEMLTGWQKLGNAWYYFHDGGDMAVGWKTIGGKTYYFKENGQMASKEWCKGYWLNADGTWTYKYKASWKKDSKGWYYQDTSGWYAKNETIKIDGKKYTFDASGYWAE